MAPVLLGIIVGGSAGYMGGVIMMCNWLDPHSNQCGLVAVFLTGPLGAIIGGGVGAFLSRSQKP